MHISFRLLLWPFQLSCRLSYEMFLSLFLVNHGPYSFSFTNITGTPAFSLYVGTSAIFSPSGTATMTTTIYALLRVFASLTRWSISFLPILVVFLFLFEDDRLYWPHLLVVFFFLFYLQRRRGGTLPLTFTFPLSLQECVGTLPLTVTSLLLSGIPIPSVILLAPCSDIL